MDRESAREHLIGVVRAEIERLEEKAQNHQERAELMAELGPNLAKFDLSHEGLLMLRYEFAWQPVDGQEYEEAGETERGTIEERPGTKQLLSAAVGGLASRR